MRLLLSGEATTSLPTPDSSRARELSYTCSLRAARSQLRAAVVAWRDAARQDAQG